MVKGITIPVIKHVAGLLLTVNILAGCSGIKPYPDIPLKNLHIRTETDSGSFFSKVRASVDIYHVDANCKTEYIGTVDLKKLSLDIGLPVNRLSYLVFVFHSSSFLLRSSSTITYDTLLKPRADHRYDIKVRYVDDIYNVVIHETQPQTRSRREVDLKGLDACRAF